MKKELFSPKPGRLTDKQLISLFDSDSRVNIWEGSVRSGKTHITLLRFVNYILDSPPGDLLMMGKTYGTLTRNIVLPLQRFIGRDMRFKSSQNLVQVFDRDIYCYGAGTKEAAGVIQGGTFAGGLGDELSLWPKEVFNMMLSRFSVEGAKFFGTTNTDGPRHWLKTDYIDRAKELGYNIYRFLIDDNTFLPPNYVAQLKKEYVGLWYKRYILSLWAIAEGAIYDFWKDELPYVIKRENYPKADYYVTGVDYGTQNPFVCGLYGVNRKSRIKIWKEAEYYYCGRDTKIQKTDSEYADAVEDFTKEYLPKGARIRKWYPDPSARSFIIEMKKRGHSVKDNVDNSVVDGIRNQARLLKSGVYAVGKECTKTRDEYSAYVWNEKAQIRGLDEPLKENDHTKDEERYVLMEEFGREQLNLEALVQL